MSAYANNDEKITGADVVYLASYVAGLPGFTSNINGVILNIQIVKDNQQLYHVS